MSKKEVVKKFLGKLDVYGEPFFTLGSIKADYEHITGTLERQGYWAGVQYRLYFDSDYNVTAESRW